MSREKKAGHKQTDGTSWDQEGDKHDLQQTPSLIIPWFYYISILMTPLAAMVLVVLVKVAQSCPTLCDPVDHTVHGILEARMLEWVAFPFSRGSSQPRDWTQVSCIAGGFFTSWATREAQDYWSG